MTKDDYLNFIDDTTKVINWIGENIENEDNAITLITWINKMLLKLQINFERLEEEKNNKEN